MDVIFITCFLSQNSDIQTYPAERADDIREFLIAIGASVKDMPGDFRDITAGAFPVINKVKPCSAGATGDCWDQYFFYME